jgi:hypothetical protein
MKKYLTISALAALAFAGGLYVACRHEPPRPAPAPIVEDPPTPYLDAQRAREKAAAEKRVMTPVVKP